MTKHVVSVSGGKDSTATLLIALDRCPPGSVVPIFCDTGNEHQAVHDYLAYLEQALDIQIHRLKADFTEQVMAKRRFIARDVRIGRDDKGRKVRWTNKAKRRALAVMHPSGNPFLDLCMIKTRFPSSAAQFCTGELKRDPAVEFQLALVDAGYRVISWQGIRRDESINRRKKRKFERIGPRMRAFRPIIDWSAEQVFAFAKAKGIEPNPLYRAGMGRVGCMPCINCSKADLRQIAVRFPDHIERIAEWEGIVSACSKRGSSTFFPPGTDAHAAQDVREVFAALGIRNRVEWSKTTRGGKQFDLLQVLDEPSTCSSVYGLCE
ncbi:phosphoadenosine phosphosulfate reductase [Verminephrobacter aporrectodeae subsp. tuberculatae]|uniref:Phosphoadenosine phosphosulfate reductase n=1 Tax=Verminephrobacter aporrectodeae subsp. tuberculatae TaxID=1110392 RepID=A0ABT3L0F1_9BURK|nr:phosphoadenosine phosphosulfate reductase family protein [Verminephrobacter aporrectodeae]MCW5323722.1 phosphoadenosine phosphosulfate reductase [Verminephrobacter aporrectodeae subsp. tuberculatae]